MKNSRVLSLALILSMTAVAVHAHAAVRPDLTDNDPELQAVLKNNSTPEFDLSQLMEFESPEETAAKEADIDESEEQASVLEYEQNKTQNHTKAVLNRWEDAITYMPNGGMVAEKRSCMNFVQQDGRLGPFAAPIKKYILGAQGRRNYGDLFFRDDLTGMQLTDDDSVCRNWAFFDKDLKIKFWAWVFASIGNQESDCKLLKGKTKGTRRPNGSYRHCAGITQMNWENSDRRWRGGNCIVSELEIITLKGNLYCALDIMAEGLKGQHGMFKGDGRIWGQPAHSYWEELRKSKGGKIGRNIRAFKPCMDSSLLPHKKTGRSEF